MTWELRIGDCLDPVTGLASLPDKSVDVILTDPPYARDVYIRSAAAARHDRSGTRSDNGRKRTPSDGMAKLAAGAIGAIDELVEPLAGEFARLARRWVVVFSDVETAHRWRSALERHGLRYVRTGAWVKPDPMPQMTGDRPAVGFEPCTIMHAAGRMRWNGGGRAGVWTHGTERFDRPDHPCPKPIALMESLVADFTDPGELILDPFAGSGTTGVAAIRLGRRFIGWERDPKYHAVADRRLRGTREQLSMLDGRRSKSAAKQLDIELAGAGVTEGAGE